VDFDDLTVYDRILKTGAMWDRPAPQKAVLKMYTVSNRRGNITVAAPEQDWCLGASGGDFKLSPHDGLAHAQSARSGGNFPPYG